MKKMTVRLRGMTPLLMHNNTTVNPLAPETKALKELTDKTKKTDSDHEQIRRLEWQFGLYLDDEGLVAMPTENIKGSLREGARRTKSGKKVDRGVIFPQVSHPIDHESFGKNLDELYESNCDYRPVSSSGRKGGGGTVMRARPVFRQWSVDIEVLYDEAEWKDQQQLLAAFEAAGAYAGLGDYRPSAPKGGSYGRFEAEVVG